jgi:hypothetical protein
MSAPEKIWAARGLYDLAPDKRFPAPTEYIRKDVADAEKAEAVAQEREACAKLVLNGSGTLRTLAAAIRARGEG